MPRILTFQFKDIGIQVSFQRFSRDTLYGKSSIERRGEANEIYSNALLTRDGALPIINLLKLSYSSMTFPVNIPINHRSIHGKILERF
ncbi:MAG: hypothetical protein V3V33_13550 [Candidatus Lokiarchaeia archaeon]